MAISKILVPVDYSEPSLQALVVAGALARRLGAKLDLVHVWDEPRYVANAQVVSEDGHRSLFDLIREGAEREMQEFVARAGLPEGVIERQRLEAGEPASTLLRCIKDSDVDLVVIGSQGRGGVRQLLIGSVAAKLVRLAHVPVLTVPPQASQ